MARKAVHSVITEVLSAAGRPMTAQEVYDEICIRSLYEFNAKSPIGIVRNALSRHSVQNQHTCASKHKRFSRLPDGRFECLAEGGI